MRDIPNRKAGISECDELDQMRADQAKTKNTAVMASKAHSG